MSLTLIVYKPERSFNDNSELKAKFVFLRSLFTAVNAISIKCGNQLTICHISFQTRLGVFESGQKNGPQ